jgi:hypothetical protein
MIFIQRHGTVGDVPFAGDAARILQNSRVIVDWTSGGVISGVPQGDGYTLEVKAAGKVSSTSLAIGTIVCALGQSNMTRFFTGSDVAMTAAPHTYQLRPDHDWGAVTGAGAIAFTRALSQAIGAPVAIINSSVGGTALLPEADEGYGNWMSEQPGSPYANALATIKSVGGHAEFVLCMQGETNALSRKISSARYAAALTDFFARLNKHFGNPHIMMRELGLDSPFASIRAAQDLVARHLAYAASEP